MNRSIALLSIAILVFPPMPAQASPTMANVCGQNDLRIVIPIKMPLPNDSDSHRCCKKGCHAVNDRRKKAENAREDDCC